VAAGAAAGVLSTHGALAGGQAQAIAALADLGITAKADSLPQAEDAPVSIMPKWYVAAARAAPGSTRRTT
jgi:hypothetical protein